MKPVKPMHRIVQLCGILVCIVAWSQRLNAAMPLSIDDLYAERSIIGTSPERYAWSADGAHLAFLWNDHGEGFRDVWLYDPATGAKRQLTHLGDAVRGQGQPGVTEAVWLAGDHLALAVGGALAVVGADGAVTSPKPGRKGVGKLAAAPDGRSLAFVSEGALWLADTTGAAPSRMLVPARPDVAVESFEWSKQGDRIVFTVADASAVAKLGIDYSAGGEAHHDMVARAFPGGANTAFRVGVVDLAGGDPRWLARPDEQDPIWNYGLSDDGRALFVNQSDLTIKHHAIYVYDLVSGRRTTFYRFDDPVQIRPDWRAAWAPDGKGLILLTNRDGYNQLYRIAAAGAPPRQITRGAWEIESFDVDAAHRRIYFVSDQAGFAERQLYRVGIDGGAIEQISAAPGTHAPVYSPQFDRVADRFSDDRTPPELYVAALADKPALSRITESPLPAFHVQAWADVRYIDYKSHVDGAPLTARLMLPRDFDPGRRYPVIVGSVYSDAVHDQWGGRVAHPTWGLDQYLVAHGYVVVNPGIRGSFGRGKAWNAPMLGSYGGLDVDDIQDGARALIERGYADPKRIGIWGSSYGGLMTLMSLFKKPGFYAAGVAGAPASNVAHAYPEQEWIMGEPAGADFPARYQRQSALYQAAGLGDPLMIIHGTRDEVVLYADTMALVQRLIEQQKMFELVTLPGANHPWDLEGLAQTRFAYKKLIGFFDRYLKPDGAASGH